MYKFLSNNGQSVAFGFGLLIMVVFFVNVFIGLDSFMSLSDDEKYNTSIFNFGLTAMIIMTVASIVVLIGFAIYQVATDFKSSVKGLIGLGIIAVIFGIAYATASGTPTGVVATAVEKAGDVSPTILKLIDGGLKMMIILIGVTFFAFVAAEVRNLVK